MSNDAQGVKHNFLAVTAIASYVIPVLASPRAQSRMSITQI